MTELADEVLALVARRNGAVDPQRDAGWDEPVPLTSNETLPTFPVDLLPWWLGEYVASLATATQTPPDLAGMLGMSVLGAAAGGRVWISPKAGWREPLNIWTAIGLPSGERKSSVLDGMTRVFREIEQELLEEARDRIIDQRTRRAIADEFAANQRRGAAKGDGSVTQEDAVLAAFEAEQIVVPPEPRLTVGDVTSERLVGLLVEQRGRLGMFSAEGGVFGSMLGRYERGGKGPSVSLDVWLHAHAGEAIRVDRQGDKRSEVIESACLTLGIAIQPMILEELARTPELRGRGAVARFLYALPTSLMGHRDLDAPAIDPEAEKVFHDRLRWLVYEMDEADEDSMLEVSSEAVGELRTLEAIIEPRLRPSGDLLPISDWAGKLAGAVVRIAGLLHLAEYGVKGVGVPVAGETMNRAVGIGRYLLIHALAVFELMGADDGLERARYMHRFLRDWLARKPRPTFTARDVMTDLSRTMWPRSSDVEAVLDRLVDLGWLQHLTVDRSGVGRPPKRLYQPHPQLLPTKSAQSTRTHSVDYVDSVMRIDGD